MKCMIISQRQINSLTEELQALILKKEAKIKGAIKTFNSWKDIANYLKILLSSLTRAKSMILNDEKELNEIKAKCKDFSRLSQIDTNDPNSENWAITFVEIQAIIGSTTGSATEGILELIKDNLKKLKQVLDDKVYLDESNLTEGKNGIQQKIAATGRSVDRAFDKNLGDKRKYSDNKGLHRKHFDYHNEPSKNEGEFRYDFPKKIPECKDHTKHVGNNMKLLKNEFDKQTHKRNHDKEFKSNCQKERVWQFNQEKAIQSNQRIQLNRFVSSSNTINEIFTKNSSDQNAALVQPVSGAKLISRQNTDAQRGRMMCVSNFNFNSKPVMEALNILAEESKNCNICNEETNSSLILKCCGRICARCLRKSLMEVEPLILLNAFEAEKKQSSMCVCPIHKITVTAEQLLNVLTQKELEILSIGALNRERRAKKSSLRDINNPNLCIDCKEIMEDDLNSIRVCCKHKICRECYK